MAGKFILNHRMAKNIRRLRMEQHMKQDEVAAKLQLAGIDISRSTYAKIESGNRNLFVEELIALKDIFHCTYEDMIE